MDDEKTSQSKRDAAIAESQILSGRKLAVVFSAILLSVLLTALDQTILSTALPRIASHFDSFALQGWIADSYILAETAFLLVHGKLLRIFAAKYVLIAGIILFELGSLVCGLAQGVGQIIAGRTFSGIGAASIFVSMIQVISQATRLEDRARLFGIFGALFGMSSIIGPPIGGGLTDNVSWRWCFYINIPIGMFSLCVVALTLPASPPLGCDPATRSPRDLLRQVLHMDLLGAVLNAAAVTCLVLSLQWGGNTKAWSDPAVIVCFVISGLAAIAFVLWERHMGFDALAPMSVFKNRTRLSSYGAVAFGFLTRFSLLIFSYYISIFYQAAKHKSAVSAGIHLLPFILAVSVTSVTCGQLVSRTGYYWPFIVAAPFFLGSGSGLLYSIETTTPVAHLIGFQILAGIGTGLGMQNAFVVMTVEFRDDPKMIGPSMSMGSFAQFLGGTIGLGVAEPVFASQLSKYLLKYAPDAPAAVVRESPTSIYTDLPAAMVPGVVEAYTSALKTVFLLGVPVAALSLVSAAFINNLKIVPKPKPEVKHSEEV
ncbi:ABC transporter [Mycena maculata]|uniref:ABC transporter n=1 Tax=Mycena maculata TaxID=230809 RepID=A0AAD7HL70_9AGAR|nr:ABC transporter [Mycena maculata]